MPNIFNLKTRSVLESECVKKKQYNLDSRYPNKLSTDLFTTYNDGVYIFIYDNNIKYNKHCFISTQILLVNIFIQKLTSKSVKHKCAHGVVRVGS